MTITLPAARSPRFVLGASVLALVLATAGCGSPSDDPASSAPAKAATSAGAAGSTAAPTSAADSDDTATDAAACKEDSDYLSGTSTVIWTPDGKSKHQAAEAKPDKAFALTAGGKLDPVKIEVAVDEVFTVTLADDAKGITVLTIGCDDGQTMTKGTAAGIYITAPGTYAVTSGFGSDPAGTIVVS